MGQNQQRSYIVHHHCRGYAELYTLYLLEYPLENVIFMIQRLFHLP